MSNIRIKGVDIYHPATSVDNQFYLDHFSKRGKNIERFLEHMGRGRRYIIDNDGENGLTMGITAAKRVLEKLELTGEEIDMIVFSTQVPETTFPANAMFIHDAIEADHDTIILDSNANCAGMTVAVEQASHYMKSNIHVNTALIVGSDYNSLISNPEDEITYANYGDAAAAVILEKTEEETGFIDAVYFTDSVNRDKIMYPGNGLSNMKQKEDSYIKWLPFDGDIAMPPTFAMLETILQRNNIPADEIKAYCFSQFSLANILKIQDELNIKDNQIIYVGDKFGYTGTSSPFLALHEGIETGRIQRGDHVLFWTIGAGYQLIAMLIKY
ncbi:ketoacyl-ACP synthase III [Sediminibacillus albus]|uniref:3-oxoacyl-[acyl-carrier-protein] synthase-3 n=1 Tax=Sediminibacillus albus TaxID=407036 RepID=A0A1G8WJB1_9BACI|nr:ketoacyl-ACP synthase III [Sediminibacillus albus]SDJ78449.1 3-oxoacyl-[acyl-carrier-protein] synthase-3 [Sediminibacillus albus]